MLTEHTLEKSDQAGNLGRRYVMRGVETEVHIAEWRWSSGRHILPTSKRQYGCKTCGKRCIQNLGFENRRVTPDDICMAVELLYAGMPSRKVSTNMKSFGLKISYKTVQNWGVCVQQFDREIHGYNPPTTKRGMEDG